VGTTDRKRSESYMRGVLVVVDEREMQAVETHKGRHNSHTRTNPTGPH
jgi:hypothetical protein